MEMISKKVEKIKDLNVAYEVFDTVDELIEYLYTQPHRRGGDAIEGGDFDDANWKGCKNFKEAENLALNGWEEVLEKKEFQSFYNKKVGEENKMIKFKNDVVGYVPIVPNVIRGIPNCMINIEKRKVKSKIIHILYNISITCGYSSEQIMKAGLELMSAIVELERQGFRIKLTAMQDFTSWEESVGTDILMINLKNEYKKLDLFTTMFTLMHPAMFRTIGFAWYERSPVVREKSGYGTSIENPDYMSEKKINDCLAEIVHDDNVKYIYSKQIINKKMNSQEIQEFLLK